MSNASQPLTDLEIARRAQMASIDQIATKIGIGEPDLDHYGKVKAKVSLDLYHRLASAPTGRLVLVTAITPTPAGEGKTTTSIGLCDGLNRIGKRAQACDDETAGGCLSAPMHGLVVDVPVHEGDQVTKGQTLVVLESMKMQNEIKAPRDGVVGRIRVKPGESVEQKQTLLSVM